MQTRKYPNLKADPRVGNFGNDLKAEGYDFILVVVEPGKRKSVRTRVSVNDHHSWHRFEGAIEKSWRQSQGARKDLATRVRNLSERIIRAQAGANGKKQPWVKMLIRSHELSESLANLDGRTGEVKKMKAALTACTQKIYAHLNLSD